MPIATRIALIEQLDLWGVCALALPLVLPQRSEEFEGLLIEDVRRDCRELIFQTRLGGDDFNKAKQSFRCSYPPQFDPIIDHLIAGRAAGPLLRNRRTAGSDPNGGLAATRGELIGSFHAALVATKPGHVRAPADRKLVFRKLIRQWGGVRTNELSRTFKKALAAVAGARPARRYDVRGSVITDLKRAGVEDILRLYITGRSLDRKVMADYESQDLHDDMARYFEYARPLIEAIAARFATLSSAATTSALQHLPNQRKSKAV